MFIHKLFKRLSNFFEIRTNKNKLLQNLKVLKTIRVKKNLKLVFITSKAGTKKFIAYNVSLVFMYIEKTCNFRKRNNFNFFQTYFLL